MNLKSSIVPAVFGLLGLAQAGCMPQASLTAQSQAPVKPSDRVVVYYMHRTFRCVSCLTIEHQTRQALNESFASQLAAGEVEFHSEDYWLNESLAKRYGVDTVSVAVVAVADGREVAHENLTRVWELKGSAAELRAYVAQAVRSALAKAKA